MKCFLSDLDIPKGMHSIEHITPKHWLPPMLYNMRENKAPAIKVFNCMKADLYLCQWYDLRMGIAYKALDKWHLKHREKEVIEQGIQNFRKNVTPYPCDLCICYKIAPQFCVRNR